MQIHRRFPWAASRALCGRSLSRVLLFVIAACTVGVAGAQNVDLSVTKGLTSGDVVLTWTGGEPAFEVFRATDASAVGDASSNVDDTVRRRWTDQGATESLVFYRIGTRTPTHPETIAIELLRPNDDPIGRPLPIAAHWNPGATFTGQPGWDPDFMMDYLDAGEYVIPLFQLRMPQIAQEPWSYFESGLQRAEAAGIPVALKFTQWDRLFTDDPAFFGLPPADNPNLLDVADGTTIIPKTDPDGPIARWQEAGQAWGGMPVIASIANEYPDPPLIIWLNNFEQPRLRWEDADSSWRFVQAHGAGLDDDTKRKKVGDGWLARDVALWDALTAELSPLWQEVSIPVCYGAFGDRKYGLWNGWDRGSLHQPTRFTPWPLVVNPSPSYYVLEDPEIDPSTDYRTDGPQMSAMNWPFMLDEAFAENPDFFWEVSSFDGGVQRQTWYRDVQGQTYDKARYKGFVRFGLWLARPRIMREFRLSWEDRAPALEYFEAVMEAVREVHENPDFTRFWRGGTPVVNPAFPHHFQSNLYPGYTDADVDRNFLLEASANPPRPWTNTTELDVFALAIELGTAPNREWMLFAYAPLKKQNHCTITIPGYGDATVNVPRGEGQFWFFAE